MPAVSEAISQVSNPRRVVHHPSSRTKRPLWILGAVLAIALVITVSKALAARNVSSTNEMAPALRLAIGTVDLEGTELAVDSASAAKLLPIWQLLAQLNSSGAAAPEEISATIEEIRLNMSSEQISAIDSMSISNAALGVSSGNGSAPAAAASGTQVSSSAAGDPLMDGDMGAMGAAAMDGGGPMPSGSSQQTRSSSKTSSASPAPAAIQRVI